MKTKDRYSLGLVGFGSRFFSFGSLVSQHWENMLAGTILFLILYENVLLMSDNSRHPPISFLLIIKKKKRDTDI